MSAAIVVEGVSKRYRLDRRTQHDVTLIESALKSMRSPLKRFWNVWHPPEDQLHWALQDISFEVAHGECVGLIGPNGAGKSTLLRIISNLTLPTTGRVMVQGQIGSLLALGVGFSGDLTGRENAIMSAVTQGLTCRQAKRRLDEIIDFSGVREFIDVPVKRYSTGMRVRLGFSVLSTLEPEIMLIDEVLGVGDDEFREKSRDRMEEMIRVGRTVLLCSHIKSDIERHCTRTVQLENGLLHQHRPTIKGLRMPEVLDYVVKCNEEIGKETPEVAMLEKILEKEAQEKAAKEKAAKEKAAKEKAAREKAEQAKAEPKPEAPSAISAKS